MAVVASGFDDDDDVGDYLVSKRIITEAQLLQAREIAKKISVDLLSVLNHQGFAPEQFIVMALAKVNGLQFFDFKRHRVQPEAVRLLPYEVMQRLRAVPVLRQGNRLFVAVSDAHTSVETMSEVSSSLLLQNIELIAVLALKSDLDHFIASTATGEAVITRDDQGLQPDPGYRPKSRQAVTAATKIVGVWGHPITHSKSPAMQNAAIRELDLDWVYAAFDVAPENIGEGVAGLRAMNFIGVNCTVPLKEIVGKYLDHVAPDAERIGSVNTVVNRDGVLTGYSTDGPGFIWDLERQGIVPDGLRVLIWGAGGSARAIAYALSQRGCSITIANRTLERAVAVADLVGGSAVGLSGAEYEDALYSTQLLINTTTLGMNDSAMPPLPANLPHDGQIVYDIVYSASTTPLVARVQAHGCRAFSGLGLLACQGALSLSLWTGLPAQDMPLQTMLDAIAA